MPRVLTYSSLLILAAPLSVAPMLAFASSSNSMIPGVDNDSLAGLTLGVGAGLACVGLMLKKGSNRGAEAGETPGAVAERVGRFRVRAVLASVLLFLVFQGLVYAGERRAPAADRADSFGFYGAVWALWAVMLALFLATGGGFFKPQGVRRLMNDEVSNANRAQGRSVGFYAMILAALGVYLLRLATPVALDEAVHGIVTVGLAAAMLRYAWLEHRADRAA